MDRTVLIEGLLALAALFWVVLPAGVLVTALVVIRRAPLPAPGTHLCAGADATDPSAKLCWAPEGMAYCPRHAPLEMA